MSKYDLKTIKCKEVHTKMLQAPGFELEFVRGIPTPIPSRHAVSTITAFICAINSNKRSAHTVVSRK